jgi:hypothetical protein
MAAILQLRRGALTDFNSYGTNVSEPYFDTSRDTLQLGTTDGTGSDADWITLVKLSQANRNFTKNEPNTGSLWLTSGSDGTSGNYTGSNMILYNNIIVSGSGFIEGDLHLEGHLFLGSGSDDDVVRVQSEFSGSIVPDNDITGSTTPNSTIAYYDLGTTAKRYRNIFLQKDGTNAGFLSGSHIDLTGNIKVDGEGQFGTLRVDDLTDNRVLLAGVNGEVEDDSNLTYDGNDFNLSNSDFHQVGSGASFQFDGAGMEISGSISNNALAIDNGIVFTNVFGTLDNQNEFTWDGDFVNIVGGVTASQDLTVNRAAYLASAKVEDLTEDRIVIAGNRGEIEDDQYFRFTGANFIVGDLERFRVQVSNGNTFISGAVQMFSTLDVDGQSTHASLNVEDLTDNRVVIVGAGGEIEDDVNFTFNGTELNIGTGNFTVQQGSGNTQILGTLDVDSQSTLSSLNVQDLTSGRVVLAGTSGEIEDSANLTFDGTNLTVTGNTIVTGNLTIEGTQTQLNTSILNVEDKNILIASGAADATAANGGGITIDGADATLLYGSSDDSFTFNKLLKVNGNISGSSFNGTTLLSSSNENFADYSQSVDSRLDEIEGPMSTSLDSRLIEIFATGSDHETRIDEIETTFSSSVDSRISSNDSDIISLGTTNNTQNTNIGNLQLTGSDHETRLDSQESYSSSFTSNDLDMNGNKVLFGNVYSVEGDLPSATDYHGMFAHVHGTGKGYFAHSGNWIPLLNESTFTTDSASFDSRILESFSTASDHETRLDSQESFSSSIDTTIKTKLDTEAIVSGSEFTGSVNITDTINLTAQDPLPSGNVGDLAVSGSNLFFYNGAWTQVV